MIVHYIRGRSREHRVLLASSSLDAELYMSFGIMEGLLEDIIDTNDQTTIVMASFNDIPIGVCLLLRDYRDADSEYPMSSTFVQEEYRRKGVGTKLMDQ